MRRFSIIALSLTLALFTAPFTSTVRAESAQPKDWTFLIFLNGNNSLDSFGEMNLKQLETVGSTDNINIVVQWASLETKTIKRMLIKKSANGNSVTSPVIQMVKADMGDWHSVVDFVKWGSQNFPASHYFLDLWDHGSGWHAKTGGMHPNDISWDEITNHHITTQQMGLALTESAKVIGHKIDLYASDACLMAMVEIANELSDSVSVYAGSQDTEPGAGWPYDKFFARWASQPKASAQDVSKMLSEEYAKSYQASSQKVTFSSYDLSLLPAFNQSIRGFVDSMKSMTPANAKLIAKAAQKSQYFTNDDYVDFSDFLTNVSASNISTMDVNLVNKMNAAMKSFVITSNNVKYPKAHGVSIWIPNSQSNYSQYASLYSQLKFDAETHWGDFLKSIVK